MPARVTLDAVGQTLVVRIDGELSLEEMPQVRNELRYVEHISPDTLVMDLRATHSIDSSGLALLLELHRAQSSRHARFVVVTANQLLLRAFEVTRLGDVFDVQRDMPPGVRLTR